MPRFSISSIPVLALAGLASVSAALPVASSAQAQVSPQMRGEAIALMQVCRGDYDRLCAGVSPAADGCSPVSRTMRANSAPRADKPCRAPNRSRTARPLPACCRNKRRGARHGAQLIPEPQLPRLDAGDGARLHGAGIWDRPPGPSRHPRLARERCVVRRGGRAEPGSRHRGWHRRDPVRVRLSASPVRLLPRPARRPCSACFSAASSSITGNTAPHTASAGCGPPIGSIIPRPGSISPRPSGSAGPARSPAISCSSCRWSGSDFTRSPSSQCSAVNLIYQFFIHTELRAAARPARISC